MSSLNAGDDFGRIDTSQLERVAQALVLSMHQMNTIAALLNAHAGRIRQLAAALAVVSAGDAGARVVVAMLGQAATHCQQAADRLRSAHAAGTAWASQAVTRTGG